MEDHAEHIPAIVFDWLEKYDFHRLNASQQLEALRYFTEEEYRQMHLAVSRVKSMNNPALADREHIKQTLLGRFDSKYHAQRPAVHLLSTPVALWKAAAACVVIGFALLGYHISNKEVHTLTETVADTIYVTREVIAAPQRVYDTVYIDRPVESHQARAAAPHSNNPSHGGMPAAPTAGDISVLHIGELENTSNTPRGNSMKDDTLHRKYGFVTL